MNPKCSVLIISHEKPAFVKQAVYSVMGQTLPEWEALLIDSGKLARAGWFDEFHDPRLTVEASGEPAGLAAEKNPASWVINRFLPRLRGELLFLLCDDDLLYPWAFQSFWDFYERRKRRPLSMYASVHLGRANADGTTEYIGERIADVDRGEKSGGPGLDCQVDYLQFCVTREGLEFYRKAWGAEVHSEKREDRGHADGIFMERMGQIAPVQRVGYFIGMNRRTPASCNCGP